MTKVWKAQRKQNRLYAPPCHSVKISWWICVNHRW